MEAQDEYREKNMNVEIVFSDVDGTLLNNEHKMLEGTMYAIRKLQEKDIPFVIISARSPSGIYPILEENGFSCPIICYSGALILDDKKNTVYSTGFDKETAENVINFIEEEKFDCCWNLYSGDNWIVKNKKDPRVICEENIVHTEAVEGTLDLLPDNTEVGKILCICNPEKTIEIENKIKKKFPMLSVVKSFNTMIEIMQTGITKGSAVLELCKLWNIKLDKAVAFGDNFNDAEMLDVVGFPFIMGNAPEELKLRFKNITDSNNDEGIYKALVKIGAISQR